MSKHIPSDLIRVRVDKQFEELVAQLIPDASADPDQPKIFNRYTDLLVFAAAYAAAHKKPLPVENTAKAPDPIRPEVFLSHNYESIIDLLAAHHLKSVKDAFKDSHEVEARRFKIFEEYANRGLQMIQKKIAHQPDKLLGIESIIYEYHNSQSDIEEVDITGLTDL